MEKRYVVRVVEFDEARQRMSGQWIECLRYAGLIEEHQASGEPDRSIFDIFPPTGIHKGMTKAWAERNAARMQSFGINAVAAPAWDGKHTAESGLPIHVNPEMKGQ